MAADVKVELLRDVTVPREGTHENKILSAGAVVALAADVADRFIRIGAAKKVK